MATFTSTSRLGKHPDDMGWRDRNVRAWGRARQRLLVERPSIEEDFLGDGSVGAEHDVDEGEASALDRGGDEFSPFQREIDGAQKVQPAAGPARELAAAEHQPDEDRPEAPDAERTPEAAREQPQGSDQQTRPGNTLPDQPHPLLAAH